MVCLLDPILYTKINQQIHKIPYSIKKKKQTTVGVDEGAFVGLLLELLVGTSLGKLDGLSLGLLVGPFLAVLVGF